jgi:methionyl aminopeptidase
VQKDSKTNVAVILKSRQQVAQLRESGRLVAEAYEVLRPHIVPGVSTYDLDRIAEEYVRARGARPIYKGYRALPMRKGQPPRAPFPSTICVAVNNVICHGIPSLTEVLQDGDIIGIDIGVIYNGWVGDACITFPVGQVDKESQQLLTVTSQCLDLAIEQARPGNFLGDIGAAIQTYAEAHGFSVVKEYVGHGVGRSLHEDPNVMHFGTPGTDLRLKPGMVFTIEPMLNLGGPETLQLPDGWCVATADGKRSAQFEHTVAITHGAPEVLTFL